MLKLPPQFIPPRSWSIKRTPQESVLSEWRRANFVEEEKAFRQNTKGISEVLPAALQRLGLDRKRGELEILKTWNHLMDPVITAHAKPVGLQNGTLFVSVDSNVWLDEFVRYRRREILERLRHAHGPDLVRKVSFRVGG